MSNAGQFVHGSFGSLPQDKPAPRIAMQPVKSSNVSALGYDEASKTLEVHFATGGKYRYAGVSKDTFTAFLQADSKGSFFARHIRGLHDSTKAEDEKDRIPDPAHGAPKPTNHNPVA